MFTHKKIILKILINFTYLIICKILFIPKFHNTVYELPILTHATFVNSWKQIHRLWWISLLMKSSSRTTYNVRTYNITEKVVHRSTNMYRFALEMLICTYACSHLNRRDILSMCMYCTYVQTAFGKMKDWSCYEKAIKFYCHDLLSNPREST